MTYYVFTEDKLRKLLFKVVSINNGGEDPADPEVDWLLVDVYREDITRMRDGILKLES